MKNSLNTIIEVDVIEVNAEVIEADVQCLHKLHELHKDLLFLPERMQIKQIENFVPNLHEKTEYVIHIRNLKHALNHRLVLRKFNRVNIFNQNTWLNPYIDMNANLRKKEKSNFEKYFFNLMNSIVFGKIMENVKTCRDINLSQQKE